MHFLLNSKLQLKLIPQYSLEGFQILKDQYQPKVYLNHNHYTLILPYQISHLNEEIRYENLYYSLFLKSRHGTISKINDIRKHAPSMPDEVKFLLFDQKLKPGTSFYTKCYFFRANIFYYLNERNPQEAHKFFLKLFDLWESTPIMKDLHLFLNIIDIANYLGNLHRQENYGEEFEQKLIHLENLECQNFNQEAERFQNVVKSRFLFHLNRDETQCFEKTAEYYISNLAAYEHKINKSTQIAICFNIISFYWTRKDYSKCRKWADEVLNSGKSDHRKDLQKTIKVLCLIIDYEQNRKHLASKAKTLYTSLSRSKENDAFDSQTIKMVEKLVNINPTLSRIEKENEKQNILLGMKTKMDNMSIKPNGYDEVYQWVISKIAESNSIQKVL